MLVDSNKAKLAERGNLPITFVCIHFSEDEVRVIIEVYLPVLDGIHGGWSTLIVTYKDRGRYKIVPTYSRKKLLQLYILLQLDPDESDDLRQDGAEQFFIIVTDGQRKVFYNKKLLRSTLGMVSAL